MVLGFQEISEMGIADQVKASEAKPQSGVLWRIELGSRHPEIM
jgi:hypothetical protein